MSGTVLMIGGNFSPELTGIGKYNGEMIQWLSQEGFSCTVVTTYPYYPEWKVQKPYTTRSLWYKKETKVTSSGSFEVIRCPHYVPKQPSALRRLLSDLSIFCSASVALLPMFFSKKHDYVFTVAPPFALGILGVLYKKMRGAKFLYHVQDLQIDAARDLKMIKSEMVIKALFTIESLILKNANIVSTISKGMVKKVSDRCKSNVVYFPNWVDLDLCYPLANRKDLKLNYGFSPTDKIVLYSGAIGEKQGLESIINSAEHFKNTPEIKFIICGSGPYKQQLINLKERLKLKNVFFLPLQPANEFNNFLNMADVHLVLQKANASDLVLPSKLSTVFAIGGVSIVTANRHTSLYEIMSSSDMGFVIQPENQALLNQAIDTACNTDLTLKGKNARIYAERFLSINSILGTYSKSVLNYKSIPELVQNTTVLREAVATANA